ncbi:MAG: YdeI/OmpD-associated family protein [Anaerolineales bacterium]
MSEPDFSSLSRPIHPMPDFVREALEESGLLAAYRSRPPYQQNDYLGWINRAKRPETKLRRLDQMLDELKRGDVYMKMAYKPRSRDG